MVGSLLVPSPFRLAFLLANLIWAVTAVRQCYCPAPRCTPPARLTVCRLHAWRTPLTVARRAGDARTVSVSCCFLRFVLLKWFKLTHRPLLSLPLSLSLSFFVVFSLSFSLLFFIVPTIRTLRRDQLSSLSGCPLIELLTTVDCHRHSVGRLDHDGHKNRSHKIVLRMRMM